MSILHANLRQLLITPIAQSDADFPGIRASVKFWLSLSLIFSVFYSILGVFIAFSSKYVIQDDAREYVFWMQRFIDPTILPHDLVADYFTSITPLGYQWLYHLMAKLGISPLLFSKLLPIALGLITTLYCFKVSLQIFPIPLAGFVASLLLNQSLWFTDNLLAAIPRSFIYPLFLAFIYYLLKGSWRWVCVLAILQGLFYPLLVFISSALLLLRLWHWRRWMPQFDRRQCCYLLLAVGLGLLTLIPYALISSKFGSTVTVAEARMMPELAVGGRHPFFDNNAWRFWLGGEHSRILPLLLPPLIWAGLWLPTMLCHPDRFPLIRRVSPTFAILPEIIWISFSLYAAAHVLWLKLFFPSRYTEHTFRILMALASGIVLTTLLDKVLRNCEQTVSPDVRPGEQRKKNRRLILTVALALMLILYPQLFNTFPKKGYKISSESALYTFLQEQPKDIMIASLSEEASSISTFAQRSVLFSREHALPFHPVYYRQIRQRCIDLIQAQYSQDLTVVQQVIEKYGISFLLLDQTAFTPQYLVNNTNRWLSSFQPVFGDALTALEQEKVPAVATLSDRCSVVKGKQIVLLHADCILHPSQWQNGERVSKLLQSS